ncbi:probable G-protein coupled receptor 139 [Rhincodon typus]|uniref:probable G-protein coupled receptor 139 n=1 Tax=Rhincodon typus TaxID=259920 RepID=UPI002030A3AE|nr:probable G-protein coupled receptor 139 [Rhincodon typus]
MEQQIILLVKASYYPILSVVGVPVNLITILILSQGKCGLSKCISLYMVAMATANLLVLTNNVMVYYIFSYHFPHSFLSHTPVCTFILYMTVVSLDLTVWFTVSFTFDRFIIISHQRFKEKYCTKRTASVVITMFSILIFIKNISVWFAYKHEHIINKMRWGCGGSLAFFSSNFGVASVWFHSIWRVWLPFTLIILLNSLTVRCILVATRTRRALRGHPRENERDSEMENRRKSIILLFIISGSFILLWLTANVSFVTTRLTNTTYYRGDRTSPAYIATESGTMIKYLNSCTNTWIYAATQRNFREEFKKVLKFPWALIERLLKNEQNKSRPC